MKAGADSALVFLRTDRKSLALVGATLPLAVTGLELFNLVKTAVGAGDSIRDDAMGTSDRRAAVVLADFRLEMSILEQGSVSADDTPPVSSPTRRRRTRLPESSKRREKRK